MKNDYTNYVIDDVLLRNFMIPAIMPNNQVNLNNKFVDPEEAFLKGNFEAGTYIPYKNMTFVKPIINNERQRMLYDLQKKSFYAHELNLYLDTHPNDANAINLYNKYNREAKEIEMSYENKYGPLNLSDNNGLESAPWAWIQKPWPWDK